MRTRRAGTRILMALVGCSILLFYGALALVSYQTLVLLRTSAPDPATTLAIVVGVALVVGYLSYRFGTAGLLSQLEAVELPRSRAPDLYRRLDALSRRMGIAPPTVMIARLPAPNAFALGSARNGVIVLDRSLVRFLTADELEGLVAHELAHLESYDAFVQTLAYSVFRTIAGFVSLLLLPVLLATVGVARAVAWFRGRPQSWTDTLFGRLLRLIERGVMACLLLVTLVVRAHSRRREYAADDRAAAVTGKPLAFARALGKIQRVADPRRELLSPLYVHTDEDDAWSRLLSTHPATDDRIERLVERNGETGHRSGDQRRGYSTN